MVAIGVPLGAIGAEVEGEIGTKKTSNSRILFKAILAGTKSAALPEGLVWYPHESLWQEIAKGRLQYGLQNFSLDVQYKDDFGINANLKVVASMAGLNLGGKFEEARTTVWRINGTFGRPHV